MHVSDNGNDCLNRKRKLFLKTCALGPGIGTESPVAARNVNSRTSETLCEWIAFSSCPSKKAHADTSGPLYELSALGREADA